MSIICKKEKESIEKLNAHRLEGGGIVNRLKSTKDLRRNLGSGDSGEFERRVPLLPGSWKIYDCQ